MTGADGHDAQRQEETLSQTWSCEVVQKRESRAMSSSLRTCYLFAFFTLHMEDSTPLPSNNLGLQLESLVLQPPPAHLPQDADVLAIVFDDDHALAFFISPSILTTFDSHPGELWLTNSFSEEVDWHQLKVNDLFLLCV